ncbi:TorF family putative porin [Sphingomonas sp. DG1-23]|uniref:TorF family putative porin n=1 Tax=Sphingomonas sp. DG1-23 TaxID=3068316 RepID=UPI00273FF595|nr:TorF family putative porin [Sphingomonas sp. DG1-23]MDP5279255.1 TorF family putative porin [Sphingomonas sp. DG1-23]
MRAAPALLTAAALMAIVPPAAAQDVSGEAEIVSDYRYRGVSLSNGKPALQVSAELDGGAGFYLGGFGSWVPHGGGSAAVEMDAILGWRGAVGGALAFEGNVAWYHYPGAADCDYAETTATLGWERGETDARAGIAWAPRQAHLIDVTGRKSGNLYGFAGIEQGIADTPISLSLAAGYESGAFDGAARGGKLDWRAGASLSRGGFTVSANYVGAVRPRATAGEPKRERGLVLALGRSF